MKHHADRLIPFLLRPVPTDGREVEPRRILKPSLGSAIRGEHEQGTSLRQLAADFGVSRDTIRSIVVRPRDGDLNWVLWQASESRRPHPNCSTSIAQAVAVLRLASFCVGIERSTAWHRGKLARPRIPSRSTAVVRKRTDANER